MDQPQTANTTMYYILGLVFCFLPVLLYAINLVVQTRRRLSDNKPSSPDEGENEPG